MSSRYDLVRLSRRRAGSLPSSMSAGPCPLRKNSFPRTGGCRELPVERTVPRTRRVLGTVHDSQLGDQAPPPELLTWKPEDPIENPRLRAKVKRSFTLENIGSSFSVDRTETIGTSRTLSTYCEVCWVAIDVHSTAGVGGESWGGSCRG